MIHTLITSTCSHQHEKVKVRAFWQALRSCTAQACPPGLNTPPLLLLPCTRCPVPVQAGIPCSGLCNLLLWRRCDTNNSLHPRILSAYNSTRHEVRLSTAAHCISHKQCKREQERPHCIYSKWQISLSRLTFRSSSSPAERLPWNPSWWICRLHQIQGNY